MAPKTTKSKPPPARRIKPIADLIPDEHNMNAGTERGRHLLETSVQQLGLGRSVVTDRNGRVIAGNKTTEVAGAVGIQKVVTVQTDGDTLVVVQRTDLDLQDENDPRARQLAFADNRVGEVSLAWDAEQIEQITAITDLSAYVMPDELREIVTEAEARAAAAAAAAGAGGAGAAPTPEVAAKTLAERFGVPPFSVLDARQGYWQTRKAAWVALGIQSELGRGGTGNANGPAGGTQKTYRMAEKAAARKASPGGSPRPAMNYSQNKARGNGRGQAVKDA